MSKDAEASESKKTKTDKEAETRGSLEKEATDTEPSDEGCTCGAAQDQTCPVCGGW